MRWMMIEQEKMRWMMINLILYGIANGTRTGVGCFSVIGKPNRSNTNRLPTTKKFGDCILQSRSTGTANVISSPKRLPTPLSISSWTPRSHHRMFLRGGTNSHAKYGLRMLSARSKMYYYPTYYVNKHSARLRHDNNNYYQERLQQVRCMTAGTTAASTTPSETPSKSTRYVVHVIAQGIKKLQEAGIPDEADEIVFHLMAFVLKLSWESGFRDLRNDYVLWNALHASTQQQQRKQLDGTVGKMGLMYRTMTEDEVDQWQVCLERRMKQEPLQYILGQWDFLDYTFQIQPPLLCPRPETEELVLLARQTLTLMWNAQQLGRGEEEAWMTHNTDKDEKRNNLRVLDVGCGTGCIGIALCASHPTVHVTALDVNPTAISVAIENAQRILGTLDQSQRFMALHSSVADFDVLSIQQQEQEEDKEDENCNSLLLFDMVVSNPPYIPPGEMITLDSTVKDYESHVALCGGSDPDGMQVIRQIVQRLPQWCMAGATCWMEVHPTHPALLQEWLASASKRSTTGQAASTTGTAADKAPPEGIEFVQTVQDFQGKDRFVELRVN